MAIDYKFGVKLDPLDSSHLEQIREWRNDQRIWKWCRQNDLICDANQDDWFEKQRKDPAIHMYSISAEYLDEGLGSVGVCGFTSHDKINRIAEFSLYIGPEFQGQGFGKDALRTLINHGFKNLNLHSIWGESFAHNPAIKTFKKIGFKTEGIRRQAYFRDGNFVDAEIFSILEDEWNLLF